MFTTAVIYKVLNYDYGKKSWDPLPLHSPLSSLVSGFHFAVSYQWVQNMSGDEKEGEDCFTKTHFLWKYLHKICWIHYFLFIPLGPRQRDSSGGHFSPEFNKKHTSDEPCQPYSALGDPLSRGSREIMFKQIMSEQSLGQSCQSDSLGHSSFFSVLENRFSKGLSLSISLQLYWSLLRPPNI